MNGADCKTIILFLDLNQDLDHKFYASILRHL